MKEFLKHLRNINKLSKYYIKAGSIAVFTIFVLIAFCSICMGRIGNYDNLLFLRNELMLLFKEMLGAIYVPALIVEIICMAEKCSI